MKNIKQEVKSVTNNNLLTREELAKKMGLSVPTTTTKSKATKNSLKQVIQARLNEVIHETLCTEFSKFYFHFIINLFRIYLTLINYYLFTKLKRKYLLLKMLIRNYIFK